MALTSSVDIEPGRNETPSIIIAARVRVKLDAWAFTALIRHVFKQERAASPPFLVLIRFHLPPPDLNVPPTAPLVRLDARRRVTCWMPLRPATSRLEDNFGSIQLAVTYSDDYVAQG